MVERNKPGTRGISWGDGGMIILETLIEDFSFFSFQDYNTVLEALKVTFLLVRRGLIYEVQQLLVTG